jgi:hemerythrin HHE cation binding domain-containing protein
VAKKATRKTSAAGTRRRTAAKRAPKPTKTARRKNAARAAASRSTRKRPAAAKKSGKPSTLRSAATAVKGAAAGAYAAVARRIPGTAAATDAITLLETDHRRMESLLTQGEETTARAVKGRGELLDTLTRELDAHELIEEKIFYPALKVHPEAKDIVLEGYQEHHVADLLVKELRGMARSDEQWGPKFKVLKENIEHHIQEEEGPMFRTARGVMTRDELNELGARMAAMKAGALRGTS